MATTTSDRDPRYNPSEQAAPPAPESDQCSTSEVEPAYGRIPDLRLRFVDDVGDGFSLGLLGSSTFNLFRGLRGGGLAGAARAVRERAPRAAGSLAAYFAAFSALESAMSLARRKEDRWNRLAAGAASWAALGMRRGAVGAAVVASLWGLEIMEDLISEATQPPQPTRPLPAAAPADGFWFWGIPQPQGPPIEVKEVSAAGLGL